MATKPYDYDTTLPWIPRQNQLYENNYVTAHTGQQRPPVLQNQKLQQRGVEQKPKPAKAMPKARALALVRAFKKWLVVASLAAFVSLSGLVAYHHVGTAASQPSSGSSQKTPTTTSSSQATPTTSSSSQDSNGFLNQQGGNNFGSSNSSQGSTSGSSNSSQAPVSGSHTS